MKVGFWADDIPEDDDNADFSALGASDDDDGGVRTGFSTRTGVLLPYFNTMSPAPTYSNLSGVAQQMAREYDEKTREDKGTLRPPSSKAVPVTVEEGNATEDEESIVGDFAAPIQEAALNSAPVDPLPAMLAQARLSPTSVMDKDSADHLASIIGIGGGDPTLAPGEAFDKVSLVKMQQLWDQHAAELDEAGVQFGEKMDVIHTKTLGEVAQIRQFNIKKMLDITQTHASDLRNLVLQHFHDVRKMEGTLATSLYSTAKSLYTDGLNMVLEKTLIWHRQKQKMLEDEREQTLMNTRKGSQVEMRSALRQQSNHIHSTLRAEFAIEREQLVGERDALQQELNRLAEIQKNNDREKDSLATQLANLKKDLEIARQWKDQWDEEIEKQEQMARAFEELQTGHEEQVRAMQKETAMQMAMKDAEINTLKRQIGAMQRAGGGAAGGVVGGSAESTAGTGSKRGAAGGAQSRLSRNNTSGRAMTGSSRNPNLH